MAKFFPSYWYIKNNNDIAVLSNFDTNSLQPVFVKMGIVLFFSIGFFVITNVVTRLRLKKN